MQTEPKNLGCFLFLYSHPDLMVDQNSTVHSTSGLDHRKATMGDIKLSLVSLPYAVL